MEEEKRKKTENDKTRQANGEINSTNVSTTPAIKQNGEAALTNATDKTVVRTNLTMSKVGGSSKVRGNPKWQELRLHCLYIRDFLITSLLINMRCYALFMSGILKGNRGNDRRGDRDSETRWSYKWCDRANRLVWLCVCWLIWILVGHGIYWKMPVDFCRLSHLEMSPTDRRSHAKYQIQLAARSSQKSKPMHATRISQITNNITNTASTITRCTHKLQKVNVFLEDAMSLTQCYNATYLCHHTYRFVS